MSWLAGHIASGLFDTTWALVWHYGVGVGLLILCVAGAFFSPIGKSSFLIAAGAIAGALAIYSYGISGEKQNCDARIKYIYVHTHTVAQGKKYLAPAPAPEPVLNCTWGC
jgi:hypothetical protein